MHSADLPAVLSINEAAGLLRVHPKLVRKLINRGELRALKLGRIYRIPSAPLVARIAADTPDTPHVAPAVAFPDRIPPGGRPGRPPKRWRRTAVR